MAKQLFANNVSVTINEFLSATDTTITVSSTSRFPSLGTGDWIIATIVPNGGQGSIEVVKITAFSGNDVTVVRGQEGTSGQSFTYGATLELRVTKGSLEFLRDRPGYINAKTDHGAVGDGVADDTVAIQAAITAGIASGQFVYLPAGTYLITDTLTVSAKTQIVGEHKNMSAIQNGTKILFQPTSLKSLFSTGPTGAFKDGYCFENLWIVGNSTDVTGNSFRAFDLIKVVKSNFRNMRIDNFRVAFRVEATINNRFEFIQMANTYLYNIHYTGDNATTDVWEQCYISNSPIGVQTDGTSLGIRFNHCIFETLDTYGVNLVKEVYGWQFNNCYVEDVPSANVATNAMFRVGFDGTTLAANAFQLSISGGYYGGRNAGAVGAFLDVDFTNGVLLGGFGVSRFTNVVRTSANTQTNQIVASDWTAASISTMVSDTTKVVGTYPPGVFNSGTRNNQNAFFNSLKLTTSVGVGNTPPASSGAGVTFPSTQSPSSDVNTLDDYREQDGVPTACTGAITTSVAWKVTKVGRNVTLTLPATVGTASASPSFVYGEALPAAYRPAVTIALPVFIRDNAANPTTPGMALVSASTGTITIYKDATTTSNYTAAAEAGLGQGVATSLSWSV